MKKSEKEIHDLTHDQSRLNNPAAVNGKFDEDLPPKKYHVDEWSDPTLAWNSKREEDFEVPTLSIHRRELIVPAKILSNVTKKPTHSRLSLFESNEDLDPKRKLDFYQHSEKWTNRLIAGDSMLVMNSLLEREGMAGSIQMIYFDPPYGIRFGSNFQPFVYKRDVKDRDEDLSIEPETITAFRDTWEKGIHSYLNYIRDRLQLARILLSDSGSIFVQIGDENQHLVRCILDEVFGRQNFVSQIFFQKTGGLMGNFVNGVGDYLLWYANDKSNAKFRRLYTMKNLQSEKNQYKMVEFPDGTRRAMTKEELEDPSILGKDIRIFRYTSLTSITSIENEIEIEFEGKKYIPSTGHWKTHEAGMKRLIEKGRVAALAKTLRYIRYFDDFPLAALTNNWTDTGGASDKIYTVQTSRKVIERCMLMTTDPSDLVLDITCGSGTTAYVAEQFGRRWITCDTSRIAIELAKERIATAVFDFYKLKSKSIADGFEYQTVPHVTLKSIANNQPPATETLFDKPMIDSEKMRVAGPFMVESLPAPIIFSIDEAANSSVEKWQSYLRQEIATTGIGLKNGDRLQISNCLPFEEQSIFHASAETNRIEPVLIHFGSDSKSIDARIVGLGIEEVRKMKDRPRYAVFAGFSFDAEAEEEIYSAQIPGVEFVKVLMNPELSVGDLKKNQSKSESFLLVGQPDAEIKKLDDGKLIVEVRGFDYFDVIENKVKSGSTKQIAMWMLDTEYRVGKPFEPSQMFFPMKDSSRGWSNLSKTLRAEIDESKIAKFSGSISLPFETESDRVAVKIIDDRGLESMRILKIP
ncbi:MAG: site-specific DNA-methyltransferase [Selenomonadaceae bacterium]|nr:site-specific DNA-methyltransferase [Selenomonadaceae bacterium]